MAGRAAAGGIYHRDAPCASLHPPTPLTLDSSDASPAGGRRGALWPAPGRLPGAAVLGGGDGIQQLCGAQGGGGGAQCRCGRTPCNVWGWDGAGPSRAGSVARACSHGRATDRSQRRHVPAPAQHLPNPHPPPLTQHPAAHRFRKRGLAVVPTKFGISFTTKFLNQAGALAHIYTGGWLGGSAGWVGWAGSQQPAAGHPCLSGAPPLACRRAGTD